jgi:hypothetical protein
MTTRDYAWLKTKVARWVRRTDLTADIPDFIMLAEKRISADLEARLQNVVATLSTTAGVQTITLPTDLNGIRSLSIPVFGKVTLMTPEKLANTYAGANNGVPRHYAIVGAQIRLGPVPDGVYAMDCVYRAEIPPLDEAVGGVNWLITEHPEIYLAASLCEAFTAIRDKDSQGVWEGKYADAVGSLNITDWNSGGTLAVRADAATP